MSGQGEPSSQPCASPTRLGRKELTLCVFVERLLSICIFYDWPDLDRRCLHSFSSGPNPRIKNSHSPPMTLMTSQSLPPSSAISIMIISQSMDLAGLAHGENSLTLHCFLTKNTYQSILSSPYQIPARTSYLPTWTTCKHRFQCGRKLYRYIFGGLPGFKMDDTHVQEKPRRHVLANSVNTDVIKWTFQESVSSDCFSCFHEQSHIKNNVEY